LLAEITHFGYQNFDSLMDRNGPWRTVAHWALPGGINCGQSLLLRPSSFLRSCFYMIFSATSRSATFLPEIPSFSAEQRGITKNRDPECLQMTHGRDNDSIKARSANHAAGPPAQRAAFEQSAQRL